MEMIEVAGKLLGLAVADVGDSGSEDEETRWSRAESGGSYEGGASDDDEAGGKRKRMSAEDRKARNRERNRLHARKTRQRKKQHVQELQFKIWGLRQERQRLLQLSTEHRTAGVLLALSCSTRRCAQGVGEASGPPPDAEPSSPVSPRRDWSQELASHEEALRKITQEFESMDGGQQAGGEDTCGGMAEEICGSGAGKSGMGGKNMRGGKGTLADRTALRRERNRMHAKRTRNRKKLFVEACSVMIDKMKVENAQLKDEIRALGIEIPQAQLHADMCHETIPEEPLPEYLAALWEFAEGKSHCANPLSSARPSNRQTRRESSASIPSSSKTSSNSPMAKEPARPTPTQSIPLQAVSSSASPPPGQALEDAVTLCAFMEAAQARVAKRPRVEDSHASQPRVWSDHGSTTSESRGSTESDDEAESGRKTSSRAPPSKRGESMFARPTLWNSRQVLEQYVIPRQVC